MRFTESCPPQWKVAVKGERFEDTGSTPSMRMATVTLLRGAVSMLCKRVMQEMLTTKSGEYSEEVVSPIPLIPNRGAEVHSGHEEARFSRCYSRGPTRVPVS